jgi:ribosome-associated translation inhibitor RaiA
MHVQISHDHRIHIDNTFITRLNGVLKDALSRFADRITRIECHLSDENAAKGGAADKRCMLEARLNGLQPIAVTHEAESMQLAIDGAIDKLERAIENRLGKLRSR